MRTHHRTPLAIALVLGSLALVAPLAGQQSAASDDIRTIVSGLDLQRYTSTIEALSRFGDRRQGTRRNREAVDWIEAQLRSYSCADVQRLTYTYTTPSAASGDALPPSRVAAFKGSGPGGATVFGRGRRPEVNRDLMKQPDERIRELNREEPVDGERLLSHLILSHLSQNNNTMEKVSQLFSRDSGNTEIIVASRYKETPVYEIKSTTDSKRIAIKKFSAPGNNQLSLF